ncbi:MAG: PIG-L family deacetylase [Eubacteriales bacterium]|nr:PIG-L family deacetylase [Eubacteriales bacterium]
MEKTKGRKGSGIFASVIFALEVFFVCDMAFAKSTSALSPVLAAIIFASALVLMLIFRRFDAGIVRIVTFIVTLLLIAALVFGFLLWRSLYENGVYADEDTGKADVFSGRRVMVFVPHEDDEINLLGGVLEQYVKYGSQVYVVYLTNGDMQVSAEQRFAETIEGMAKCGVPEDHLIFLGYGDSLYEGDTEIYFLPEDRIVTSHAGKTQTYGTPTHPAYREGRDYTLENMVGDIHDILLEYRPDVIFCSDYDEHADHRLLSLLFDRAMGQILNGYRNYKPDVFKGFAYSTAYYDRQDFYEVNLASTINPNHEEYTQENNVYLWNDRIRFPVKADTLSRSMFSCGIYKALECYASTETRKYADGIISGDKVFWQRDTNSMLYYTDVDATSGDPSVVNDFMLNDRKDPKLTVEPSQNVWIPSKWDKEKTVTFHFTEPLSVARVKLYDNPSLEDNILDAIITLDGGTEIHTGALPKNGSAAEFDFGARTMSKLQVTIVETEGDRAGLAEVEAFEKPFSRDYKFLKLMTEDGEFVYDYYINPTGHEYFKMYIRGASAQSLDLRVSCTGGSGCRAKLENGLLDVTCPEGEDCFVTVASADGRCSDTIHVRNDKTWKISLAQQIEKYVRKEFREGVIHSNTWVILREAKDFVLNLKSA